MQKALRQQVLARNQALKRKRQSNEKSLRDFKRKTRQNISALNKAKNSLLKAERTHRREDWTLGPLAPNRVAGKDGGSYGMLSPQFLRAPPLFAEKGAKISNFAVEDRVVVVRGREKGKIGKISDVIAESQTVHLTDLNYVDVRIPPFLREQANSPAPYRAYSAPLKFEEVRLVVPLRDNATGKIKDTVVEHLRGGAPYVKPEYGTIAPRHTRYIAGPENIPIPWPSPERRVLKAEAADTLRLHLDDVSFFPSLSGLPLPKSVVDELRSKYSATRRSHTPEYIQQKMKEDAEEHWKRNRRIVPPRQELYERRAKQKEALGKPEMTQETLDLIEAMRATCIRESGEALHGRTE